MSRERLPILLCLLGYLALAAVFLVAGRPHVDEGAYLYAARAVMHGEVLYRDLFFIQPPGAPYLYGLSSLLVGEGLRPARATSVLLGLLTLVVAIQLARRLGRGAPAGWITAALVGLNSFQVYFFSITRPYSATALWFSLACLALTLQGRDGRTGEWLAGIFLGLTVATRLTALPALPALLVYLIFRYRRQPVRWLIPMAASAGVLLAVYLPHYLASPDRFYFNLLGMNLSLHSRDLGANLLAKARATSHLARRYLLLWLLLVFALFYHRPRWAPGLREAFRRPGPRAGSILMIAAVFAGHHLAKIYQESYQVFLMPAIAAVVAAELAGIYRQVERASLKTLLGGVFVVGCVLTLLGQGRENLALIEGRLPVQILRQQAHAVAIATPPARPVFSADSALVAVEANRDVLEGMAASDYFPDWSTEKCRRFRVTNDEILIDYVRRRVAGALILGDLSFTLSLPYLEPVPPERKQALLDVIEENYELMEVYPNLFIPGTRTYLYIPRSGEDR